MDKMIFVQIYIKVSWYMKPDLKKYVRYLIKTYILLKK